MSKKKYKVASMFAGVGGICLGFKKAGAQIVWANEIDKYACVTYRENFGDKYLVEADIHNIDTETIPKFDILTSGYPCQPFSLAGYRRGFDDERGNLFFETLKVLIDKTPRSFLIENVKNLVAHDNGRTFKVICDALEDNKYYIKKAVLNSMDYGNVPQNRERIYIVGFLNEKERDDFRFPEPIQLTKSIHDVIEEDKKQNANYYYTKESQYYDMITEAITKHDTVYQLRRVYIRENQSRVCPTLTANMGTGGHNVPLVLDNYGYRKLIPRECFSLQGFPEDYILPEIANCHLYKQAGNSVTVTVIQRIADNIIKTMEKFDKKTNEIVESEVATM